jgi:hypothetical protein
MAHARGLYDHSGNAEGLGGGMYGTLNLALPECGLAWRTSPAAHEDLAMMLPPPECALDRERTISCRGRYVK